MYVTKTRMKTSRRGSAFRIAGPLWGNSSCHQWIPLSKGQYMDFDVFFYVNLNKGLYKQSRLPVIPDAMTLKIMTSLQKNFIACRCPGEHHCWAISKHISKYLYFGLNFPEVCSSGFKKALFVSFSLKFQRSLFLKSVNDKWALFQAITWRREGYKPFFEAIMSKIYPCHV